MITRGLIDSTQNGIADPAALPFAGVVGALLAIAIGIRVPHQFATWVCTRAWSKFVLRGQPGALPDVLMSPAHGDAGLHWVTISVISLLTGLATALLTFGVPAAAAGVEWVRDRFLCSPLSLMALHALAVFMAGIIPLAGLGLLISCAHHVSCRFGQWESRATAWLWIGASVGLVLSGEVAPLMGRGDLILPAASIPILIVALICAGSVPARSLRISAERDAGQPPLPMWSDRRPTLLRAAIVLAGVCAVCMLAVLSSRLGHVYGLPAEAVLPAMFAAMGVGVLAGSRARQSGLRTIGGFGAACAAAGVIAAIATIGAEYWAATVPALTVLLACASVSGLGFAMAYGQQILLHRVASRSAAGVTVLWRLVMGGAVVVWISFGMADALLLAPNAPEIIAAVLILMGGALLRSEFNYSTRKRRLWLCTVFATLALLTAFQFSQLRRFSDADPEQQRLITNGSAVVSF